jgi:transglutaminase-like putative cysteine protease
MKYRIVHETTYQYSEPASLSQNELFLHPRETTTQRLIESELVIVPQPQYLHRRSDYFGNVAHVFMVQQPHNHLAISATCLVTVERPTIPVPADTAPWETVAQRLAAHDQPSTLEAYQFVFASPLISVNSAVLSYAQLSFPPGTPVLAGAVDLINRIFTEFSYDKSATNVDTSVDQLLANRKGVCQDFAHLGISCLRSLGLAARYVSGYLETKPPPGKPRLVGADASHAWLSLFVPDTGWVDLDPTNNLIPDEHHVTLAWGRDYGDVTPVKGIVMGGGVHNLSVMVDVEPRNEAFET